MTSYNEWPQFLTTKVFLSITALNEWFLFFGYVSLQKYFFNILWLKEKTFKRLYFETYRNTIKINAIT